MTPTGEAPATSELALAYNGANYKINPANLVASGGGGGGIQAVRRFQQGYIGNNYGEAGIGLNARDGNLTPGKWIAYKTNNVPVSWNPGPAITTVHDPITNTAMSQDRLIALVLSGNNSYGITNVANRSQFEPYMVNATSPICSFAPYVTIDFDGTNPTNGVSNTYPLNGKASVYGRNYNQPETVYYDQRGSLSTGGDTDCAYRFNVSSAGVVSLTNKLNANAR